MNEDRRQSERKKIPPVVALYIFGAVFIVSGLLFPVYKMHVLLLTFVAACLIFIAVERLFCAPSKKEEKVLPVKFTKTGVDEADAIIKQIRAFINRLGELQTKLGGSEVAAAIKYLRKVAADIANFVERNPENGRQLNTFTDYYVPTTVKLLESYAEMHGKSTIDGNITTTLENVKDVMKTIQTAFDKQLDTLYEAKNMDVSAEIDVLKTILRREGLE